MSTPRSPAQLTANVAEIRSVIEEVLRPGHFFVKPGSAVACRQVEAEELFWEIFHGRLLDASQTRQKQTFASWNVYVERGDEPATEPILSVKFDEPGKRLYVVRSILCHAWEAYDDGSNVILSREVRKWIRELVGSIDLSSFDGLESLRQRLARLLFEAVVGISRLPLTSIEAPLPSFTLGLFAYFYSQDQAESDRPHSTALKLLADALTADLPAHHQPKLLEAVLRSIDVVLLGELADVFVQRWQSIGRSSSEIPELTLAMFDEVALSPYTDFVDKTLAWLQLLEERGHLSAEQHIDFLGALLRRLGRHLTAFDLVKFHHQGANYPDALLLDAALKRFLNLTERKPTLLTDLPGTDAATATVKRLRRRALRQAWLLRSRYEGHPVPDLPTSLGENARVLPESFPHLSDAAILDPTQRSRKLFDNDPMPSHMTEVVRGVLQASIVDLIDERELRELGTALFLDRPLGAFKRPGEPDRTPLLSYVAFSRSLAEKRLRYLANDLHLIGGDELVQLRQLLKSPAFQRGVPIPWSPRPTRPGTPSLQDAFKVADDFLVMATTRRSAEEFFRLSGNEVWLGRPCLIVGVTEASGARRITVYDQAFQPSLALEFSASGGYVERGQGEMPASGLVPVPL